MKKYILLCVIFLCSITNSFSQFTDSILSFRNAFFQSTTTSSGGNGDYIQLPNLDMSGHFTIETWFKNSGNLGGSNRVFDFGSGPNNGLVFVGFSSSSEIYFYFNGYGSGNLSLPANFRTNDWNHIAVTRDIIIGSTNTYLYVNGQLIGQLGVLNDLGANSCTSNFIGRSNWSTDAATRAQYHDFRIWKRARSAGEIQATYLTNIVNDNNSLYYYLPLTNRNTANPVQTINIPNNTVLNNVSTSAGFVNASASIISQNGSGAKYYFDSSLQMIYGTYSGTLQTNEIFQLSIDTGKTWIKIDTAFNNHFQDIIPVNFRYGIIQIRSVINDVATSRFLKDTLTIAPIITYQFNRINTIQGTKGTLDSIIRIDSGGSNRVIKFSITSGKVSGINIDSLNGNISLDSSVAVGLFNITVTATNESGSSNTNIVILIKAMINNSIRGFYNNAFQTTTVATGGSGDYIRLPTLDMSGNYTIETWFKNTGTLGNWNRIFEFGSGGVNNGVLIGFPSANQIAFLSNGSPHTINLPNYFNINGWNHIALTFDGSYLRLYINGNYASDLQSPGANYIAANSCTVNYIGRSTYNNDVTTSGEFQEFRIYKSWKSTSDIQKSYRTIDLLNTDDLYYYLPLVRPNIGYNRFINNATSLNNDIISFNQLNQPSTITSQGNTGARYFYDSNRQVLFGTISSPLQTNERIQYSINSGSTWTNVDTVIDFNWLATLPPSFKWGVIQVRSNIDQNRIFKNDTFYFPPANFSYSANIAFDTFGTRGHSVLPTIVTSGNTKFRIKTGMVSGISIDSNSGQINWTDSLTIRSYNLTITATNELGFDTINYTLNVVNLLSNFVYSLDSVSVSYGSSGSSVTPTISGLPAPNYRFSSITPVVNGVSINTSTGIISWSNAVPVGTYIFKVIAANSISADSNTYFKLTVKSLKPIISYSINSITEEQNTADNSVTPTINATGLPITYSIDSFPTNAISINSLTGVISWTKYIPVGTYNLIVKAKHSADSGLTNFTLVISPIADTVLYFSNSAFQTSTDGTGGAGDYVRLPTLDMSGSYTIETWFKNTSALGSWRRVFDFGSGSNSSGILLGFPSPTQIGFHSNGGDIIINIPANFSTNGWNHFALSFDGTNLRLFINGFLVNTNATQPVAAATCTSNFIARSNYNDPSTQGLFQEFRIWKKARTSQEIQASYRSSVQRNSQALYYYLPLDDKLFNTRNIANNTTLANYATASGALNGLSTITSQNNGTGAKYNVDLNRQRLNGRYKDTLLAGETIQVSYDTGLTWRNVRYAANNYWYDSLTTPFNGGLIKLRSILNNIVTSRIFADFIQYLKPTEPIMNYALSNASNSALVSFEPSLRSGGSTLNYNIVSQPGNIMANTTSSPAIITGLTNNTNYTFTVRAVNAAYASEPSLPSNIVTPYDSLIINTSVKNGNINVGPIKTPLGSFYRVTFSPTNSNYLLDSVIINNTLFTDSPFGYTFNNIVTNNTIRVIYKPIYFSVQINEGLNGLNATRKINQIAYGDSLPIKYVAQNGFVVDSIFVNARYVGGGADSGIYIFRNITGDSLIKITYKPKTLLISTTTNNVLGGTINSSNTVVTYGGSVNLNYAPNSGFYVDSVYINRVYNRDTSSNFTINNITSNLEIRVIFTSYETPQPVNNVVALAGYQKAIISFSLPNNYKNTGVVKYYVTSTPGNFTDSGYASPIIISGLTNNTSYTFTVKDSNVNGSSSATSNAVTPTDTTVNIITRVSEGGVIQNSFIIDTNITKTSRVTYTNQTGYVLDSIIINGIFSGRDSLQGYTFRNINGDSTIRLVYKLQTFSITASVNNLQGGTITPFGTNTVLYGSTPVYSLVPNLGYKIDSIKINNINVPLTNNYQFASISSSNTIQAFFGKIKYNIVRTVINGSMYSNTSNAVDYDSTLRVTFNGNAGYILDSVLANGTRVDSVNGYTFVNVRSNQQIQIYYRLPIYRVFSSAIGPASITPLGLSQVNNGDSIRFNLSYLNNIVIDSILVSSIKVTYNNPTTYTIKNITSNQSIVVYSSSLPLPNKPENVITQPLNSNQILLSWLVPTQIVGSEINGYEVTSIRNDGILKIQTSASNRILVNVDSFYTYKFVVKSRNAVGFSAGDTTETFSTIKFVSIIPKLVDDNGLSATDRISTDVRTKLTSADSLAIPIGNQILYSYDSGKTFVVQTYNGGNFIIPQQNSILGNKNILVRVYNGFDTTALNQGLNVILASYPPKITIAGVSKINNQIQIRWDSPILLNQVIPITSYEIQSLPIAGGTPITSMVLFNNDTSFLITGLSSFQGYRTTVKLINAIGKSLTTDTGRIVYNMPQLTPKLYIDNGISSTDNISTDGRSYLLPTGVYENFSDADNVTNSIGPFHPANFPYIKTTASYLATDGTIQRICKLWYQLQSGTTLVNTLCVDPVFDPISQLRRINYTNSNISPSIEIAPGFTYKYSFDSGRTYIKPNNNIYIIPTPTKNGLNRVQVKLFAPGNVDSSDVENGLNFTLVTKPSKPYNIVFLPGYDTVTIRFNSPIDNGGLPINKVILQQIVGGTLKDSINNSSIANIDSFIIRGLSRGVPYRFSITAVNSFGLVSDTALSSIIVLDTNLRKISTNSVNGTITNDTIVYYRNNARITYKPNIGYILDSIYINNNYVSQISADSINNYTFLNVLGDSSIKVVNKIQTFIVTSSSGNYGSISFAGIDTVNYGDTPTYVFVANTGYVIDSLIINDSLYYNGLNLKRIDSFKFDSIKSNQRIRVTFKVQTFTVTSSAGNYGSISFAGIDTVNYGDTPTYVFVANTGYVVDSLIINDSIYYSGLNLKRIDSFKFDSIKSNQTIRVTFKVQTFNVTASAGMGGSINPSGIDTVNYGDSATYAIKVNIGYLLDSIIVNKVKVNNVDSFKFDSIKSNQTIRITFKVQTFTVTASDGIGGNINPAGLDTVNYGDTPTYVFVANTGYVIDSLIINDSLYYNGLNLKRVDSFKFDSIKSNQRIRVTFKVQTFTVTSSAGNYGSISFAGIDTVNYGDTPTYVFVANTGYVVDSLIINDSIYYSGLNLKRIDSFKFDSIKSNQRIRVTFKVQTFTVTSSAGNNGSISFTGIATVNYGDTPTYVFVANTGYVIDSLIINDSLYYSGLNLKKIDSFKFDSIKSNQRIRVTFKVQTFTIMASAGNGGIINPNGVITVNYGSSSTFIIKANYGYLIDSLLVNGSKVNNDSNYTFVNVKSNQTIYAAFKPITKPSKPLNVFAYPGNAQANIVFNSPLDNGGVPVVKYVVQVAGGTIKDSIDNNSSLDHVTIMGLTNGVPYRFTVIAVNSFGLASDTALSNTVIPQADLRNIHIDIVNGIISRDTAVLDGHNITITYSPNFGYTLDSIFINNNYSSRITADSVTSYTFNNVLADSSIKVVYKIKIYTIAASAGNNGSINPIGIDTVNYGATPTYIIIPDDGYEIDSVIVNGVNKVNYIQQSYTFDSITSNQIIRVTFKLQTFTINAIAGNGGSINPAGITTVNYGTRPTYTIIANMGYVIDSLLINGNKINTVVSYTFDSIKSNQTIFVTFKLKIFTITASAGTGGIINPTGIITEDYGSRPLFIITANTGYVVDSLIINDSIYYSGLNLKRIDSFKFDSIKSNQTIRVTFKVQTFTIKASAGSGGSINPAGITSVNYGDRPTYTIAANLGYIIDSLFINGVQINKVSSYTFDSITSNQIIRVTFKVQTFTISSSAGNGGSISPSGINTVNYGDRPSYLIQANYGFLIDSVLVNGIKIINDSNYTFDSVKSNQTIYATFKQITNPSKPLNVAAFPGNAQATINFSSPLDNGGVPVVKYIVQVDGGTLKDSIYSSASSDHLAIQGLLNGVSYRFTVRAVNSFGLISDTALTNFVLPDSNLRNIHTEITNGTITKDTAVFVGNNVRITYKPNNGYILDSIFINNSYNNRLTLDSTTSYTFYNILGDSSIKVKNKIQTFTIAASAGMGGSIYPDGIDTVNYGDRPTYIINPDEGYEIDSIIVNGVNKENINEQSYTFDSIKSNQTIRITFKVQTFTIAASAGIGGTISPSGIDTVNYGTSPVYIIVPDVGYEIDSFIVNGLNKVNNNQQSYTFDSIKSNQTIRLTFKLKTFTISANAKNGLISPTGNNVYKYGSSQMFTFSPTNSNYVFDSLVIDGILQPNYVNNFYTFEGIQQNHSIYVVYNEKYTINISSNIGGVVTPATNQQVLSGSSLRVSWAVNQGYSLDSVLINGIINTDSLEGYTFVNIQDNQTIRIVFKQRSLIPNNNFNISITQPNCVLSSGILQINATVSDYYKISIQTANGQNILDSFRGITYSRMLTDTGLYKLSISLLDTMFTKFNRYFEFNIRYPKAITAYSEIESQDRLLTLSLSGAAKYEVVLNGQLFTTELATLKLPLQTGLNTVVIKSDLPCQDSIIKTILVSESVTLYPNPVKDYVNINVGGEDKELSVEIFDNVGKLVISKNATINENRNITIDVHLLKSGVYYVKLKGTTVFGTYSLLKGE